MVRKTAVATGPRQHYLCHVKVGVEEPEHAENPGNGVIAENTNPANPDTSSYLHHNRHWRRTSCLRLSQASARSSRHRTLRFPHELRSSSSRATTTRARCLRSRAEFRAGQNQSQRQSQKQNGGIAAAAANVGMTTTTMAMSRRCDGPRQPIAR
jgi:hypothetical protein